MGTEACAAELAAFTATLHEAPKHLDVPDRHGQHGRRDSEYGCLTPAAPRARPVEVQCSPVVEQESEQWRSAPVACALGEDGLAERAAQQRRRLINDAEPKEINEGVRLTLATARARARPSGLRRSSRFDPDP